MTAFSRTVSGTVTTWPAISVAVLRSTLRRGGATGTGAASPAGTAVGVDACSLSMTAGVQSYSARGSACGRKRIMALRGRYGSRSAAPGAVRLFWLEGGRLGRGEV